MLVLSLLVAVPTANPAAAVTTYSFLQFNMCGNVCNGGNSAGVVPAIQSSITSHSPQPVAVTLNEVCRNQVASLDGALTSYSSYFVPSPGVTCSNGETYGNAVLYRSGTATRYSYALPGGSGLEPRTMACVHKSSPDIAVCATHLTNGGTTAQQQARTAQAVTVASVGESWARTVPTFVGGDFNATPTANELDVMYRSAYGGGASGIFNEGEGCCARTGEGTHEQSGTDPKIDYGFASTRFGLGGADATSSNYSDHDPYWVTLSL